MRPPLELVSETVNQDADLGTLHDLIARLLLRRYRRTLGETIGAAG
jgi:hypothetical protein